jgi:hypothetical protein
MARTHRTPGQWRHAWAGAAEATAGPVLNRCDTDPTRTEPHATACRRQSESGVRDRPLVPVSVRWNMPPGVPERDPSPANSPLGSAERAGWRWLLGLQQPYVGGLGALRPLRHVELDGLPLSK